jgi:hypothetical protein
MIPDGGDLGRLYGQPPADPSHQPRQPCRSATCPIACTRRWHDRHDYGTGAASEVRSRACHLSQLDARPCTAHPQTRFTKIKQADLPRTVLERAGSTWRQPASWSRRRVR